MNKLVENYQSSFKDIHKFNGFKTVHNKTITRIHPLLEYSNRYNSNQLSYGRGTNSSMQLLSQYFGDVTKDNKIYKNSLKNIYNFYYSNDFVAASRKENQGVVFLNQV